VQKRFKILSVAASLFLASCGSGPKVTVCVSDPQNGGFQCVTHDDKTNFLPYTESENYVALPPDDMRSLIEYCGLKSRDKVAVHARVSKIESLASNARRHFYESRNSQWGD
jgi:hypothetical protein